MTRVTGGGVSREGEWCPAEWHTAMWERWRRIQMVVELAKRSRRYWWEAERLQVPDSSKHCTEDSVFF